MANCREFALDDLAAIVAIPVWKQCGTGMSVESLAGLVQDEDSIVVGSFVRAGSLIPILHATGKVSDTVSDTVAGRLHTVTVKCDVDIRNPEVVPFLRRLQQTPSHLILTSHNGDRFGVYATEYTYLCETEQDDEKTPLSIRIQSVMGLQRIIDVESIVLSATSLSIQPHDTATLSATVLPSNATDKDVEWHSSNPGVATVDANGKVTAMALGSCVITCTAKDGSGITATCSCEVANVLVADISLSPLSLSFSPRDTQRIEAVISPSNATNKNVLWRSDDTSVADVDADGTVTAVSTGTCHIICEATDGSGVSESCECNVSNRMVTGITLSKASLSLPVGESEELSATLTPDNVTNADLIWSSSNESVALVNPMGMVTAVAEGSCTIVCMAADGSGVSSSCSCDVVEQPVTNITLSAQSLCLLAGEKKTIVPTILPSYASNKTLVWSSSDTDVATVDGSGEVTAVAEGSCTITCTASDGGGASAACSLNVYAEYVDLGLPSHTLWATRNVGAEDPSEHGDYFAWGETEPKESYTEDNYKHASGPRIINSLTKYNNDSRYGVVDNKTELEPEDDAAAENLGEDWLMPNMEQANELIDSDHTTIERASIDGVEGFMVTSKSNGKSLFLPVSGFRDGKVTGNPLSGYYWLKVLNEQFSPRGRMLQLYGISSCSIYDFLRSYGLCLRPVFGAYLFLNQYFIFRQTSNGALNAKIKNAYIERIKGNTLAWNQWHDYMTNPFIPYLSSKVNVTQTNLQYDATVLDFTTTGYTIGIRSTNTLKHVSGHKYCIYAEIKSSISGNFACEISNLSSGFVAVTSSWTRCVFFRTAGSSVDKNVIIKPRDIYYTQENNTYSVKDINIFDLTLIYGSGNEPSTPEEFEADYLRWFGKPLSYEPYDAGSLRNVQMQGLKTTGFNQWDEEWEVGAYDNSGLPSPATNRIRCKNYIPVIGGSAYYYYCKKALQDMYIRMRMYDANYNYVAYETPYSPTSLNSANYHNPFTIPSNVRYIKFDCSTNYGSTYNNDICINISDTNKNGTYEPYEEHNVSVPVTELKVQSPNIWDEEWEVGQYRNDNGALYVNNYNIRCKNLIPVIGGSSYYCKCPSQLRVCTYDSEKNFLGLVYGGWQNDIKTFDNNVAYISICTLSGTSSSPITTYNNDICINISHNGINGTYYPHGENGLIPVFPDGMKGVGDIKDEIKVENGVTKAIKRIGRVDLGSLSWTYSTGSSFMYSSNGSIGLKSTTSNLKCGLYTAGAVGGSTSDKTIGVYNGNTIRVKDLSYTDATTFQTAMDGVYLNYELAEPVEYIIDDTLNLQYDANRYGTEEVLPVSGEESVAPTLDVAYK